MYIKLIILSLILFPSFLFSQFPIPTEKNINTILESVTVILLEEEDKDVLYNFRNKPEKLKNYKQEISDRNKVWQSVIENHWNFNSNFIIGTYDDLLLLGQSGKNVTILQIGLYKDFSFVATGLEDPSKPAGVTSTGINSATYSLANTNEITTLKLWGSDLAFEIYLPNSSPTESDMLYGLMQLQYILHFHNFTPETKNKSLSLQIKENARELKTSTLLIDKSLLAAGCTENSISKVYPYPFKIVDKQMIANAVINRHENTAFIQITEIPEGDGSSHAHTISGTADGKIYYYYAKDFFFYRTPKFKYNEKIKLKSLKRYKAFIEGNYQY
ncbi:MAG: hypothetical protein IPM77_03800 [Crocinitomicaceae bacterium]|nr:hypothetical protein [Crocinitomicaceae bacterium]